jgi:hypothetical protein
MYYAWMEDLANVSGIEFNIYDVMTYAGFAGIHISYNAYYHDYTGINWNLYL